MFKRNRLVIRLIVALVLFSALTTVVITAVQLYIDYEHDISLIDTRIRQIEEVHLPTIARSLWEADELDMQFLVDGIRNLPDMQFIQISEGDRVWVSAGRYLEKNVITRQFPLISPGDDGVQIGILTVTATLDNVNQRLIDRIILILVSNALKIFLVAAFILLVAHYLIMRHLVHIGNFVRELDIGDATQLQLEREHHDTDHADELDLVVQGLNTLHDNLRNSFQELEAKNTDLERFVYTISHEIKTPLVTISGFLGIMQKDIAQGNFENLNRHFDVIQSATSNMGLLLEQLLELSRIGHDAGQFEAVALDEVVRGVIELFEIEYTTHEIEINIPADLPMVYGDRIRLGEVFQNLLENAIKFTATEQHPKISISCQSDSDNIICAVSDNGPGIDSQYHQRVFNLFERLDNSTEGTGVGLSIVRRIVEAHGGEIWIESPESGKGSVFRFSIPRSGGVAA